PCEGDVGRSLAKLLAEALPGAKLLALGVDLLPGALGIATDALLAIEHSTEQAALQRTPGDHADTVVSTRRQHFQLDIPAGQRVLALLADDAERAQAFRRFARFGDLPAGMVAHAGIDDLALLPQHVEGAVDFFPRGIAIHVMHLIEVDAIGLQA